MSKRANPTAIGLFLIGAVILGVIGIAVLASTAWFSQQTTFISYFGESVNGLERGAPVKFQGVPVGSVTELLIQIDPADKTFQVPVQYEIDIARFTTSTGTVVQLGQPEVLRQQIEDGLRAQLQMESFVTGQLYIELSYRTDPAPPEFESGPTPHLEIPTTISLVAALGTEAGSVMGDVMRILFQVNDMLESIDMREINESLVASAQAFERLVDSEEIRAAIGGLPRTTEQFTRTMAELEILTARLTETIDPLQQQVAGTNEELVLTLQATRQTIEAMQGLLMTDSGVGYQLEQTLASLQKAAEALRVLAISLEENPDMLIRGRKPPER